MSSAELGAYAEWIPRDYLREYYTELQADERLVINYFVEQFREASSGPVLCFGSGPTLHHVFLAAQKATEVCLADYVPENLAEIARWQVAHDSAHDWTPFIRYTLLCETGNEPSEQQILERTALLRSKIAGLARADASLADPLGAAFRARFAAVLSPYCAEAATQDKALWARYCRNIATLVRPGGLFLTCAVRRCRSYKVGARVFATAEVDEHDLRAVLARDFVPESVQAAAKQVPAHVDRGFSSIVLARALKAAR